MENVIADRLKDIKLTKAQQKIAEYFLQNPERVGMSSSMEVAKAIGVSDASITRFARAIGYEGFSDLKNDIYTSMAAQASGGLNSLSLVERFDSNRADYDSENDRAAYITHLQFILERTFQQNRDELFDVVASMLIQAEHHYIVGFRGCLGVASQCAWLLRFLLDRVVSISDEGPGGVGSLQDANERDCVVFFSLSRYYRSDLRLAELAKKKGAKICLITNSMLSPLSAMADVVLIAESRNVSFFNSTAAMNAISEYLVTKIAQNRPEVYRRRANERDELTKELRL